VTAVICTHNRAALLPAALESLLAQSLPPTDYEILVIDNASTDETPQILQRYLASVTAVQLRSAVQPILGLSHARNLAIELAAGDIIAFMDDDAVAGTEWLAALLETYQLAPHAWAVGGKVLPLWEVPRPDWLQDRWLGQLSLLDLGDQILQLAPPRALYGVNCSFRRSVFAALGLFRTDLGRRASQLWGSEESELQARIRQHGGAILYNPQAQVWHAVPASRLRRRYFVRLAYYKGRDRVRLMILQSTRPHLLWRSLHNGLSVGHQWLRLCLAPLDSTRQLQALCATAGWAGFLVEMVHVALGPSS
jgi:glycosyltransferase involved in cell wall biosynthesis